jgi:aminoglycoside phosphotransferase (APT) family kinase protein
MPETAPIRPGEELDAAALLSYLRGKLDGVASGLTIEQFPGGHSNLTYLLRSGGREYVLRRGPLGPVPPKAHDMAREFTVLRALHPHFPPAPRVYLLCEDPAVLGSPFFVMERRHGIVLRREFPSDWRGSERRVSEALLNGLIALHSVDIDRHGLRSIGKPEGFLERQIRGWADRWERAKTEEIPQAESIVAWLRDAMPVSGAPAFLHNDYKLDNVMLDAHDPGRLSAVLDWEMATVGDPLLDLGVTLCYWTEPGAFTTHPGWYTREEILERYAAGTGRDLSRIAYYEVFGIFKLAVILQQIYVRWVRGQTRDDRFGVLGKRVRALIEWAVERRERAV